MSNESGNGRSSYPQVSAFGPSNRYAGLNVLGGAPTPLMMSSLMSKAGNTNYHAKAVNDSDPNRDTPRSGGSTVLISNQSAAQNGDGPVASHIQSGMQSSPLLSWSYICSILFLNLQRLETRFEIFRVPTRPHFRVYILAVGFT